MKVCSSGAILSCLRQRQCTAAGIFMERIPRSDGLAAGRSVYLWGGSVAVHALSGQWHHWNTGEPSWADLSLAQSLHCPVLHRLRELQTLSRWGSGPSTALCQAISSHLSKHDLGRVKPRLHDKYHTNPEASSSIWSIFLVSVVSDDVKVEIHWSLSPHQIG